MKKRIEGCKRNLSFENKVVWITGASSGIGEALTYAFARKGAKLILSSRNKKALENVKNNCAETRNEIHLLPLDLSKLKTLNKKAKKAFSIFGRIDVMVHNAGLALRDLVVNTDIQIDKKIMDINYFAAVVLTKAVLPSMLKRESGHFLVISSVSGKYGVPKLSAYSASKHALHGFFDSLRAEVAQDNIKITMVVPGFVRTNITVNALKGDGTRYGKHMQVQEKGLDPSTVATKILEKAGKNKEEVLIGRLELLAVYCKRFFPVLFSKIIRNHPIERIRSLKSFFSLKKYLFKRAYRKAHLSPPPLTQTLTGQAE
jgi:dehydrogenase/reductase SDR family protein 7B